MNPVLNMVHISKTFPGVKALSDVSFTIEGGDIHGLIGENGAGKSTLMNVLMGIYRSDEGEVFIDGEKKCMASPAEAIQSGIGMVPQELNLALDLTIAENIFLGNDRKRFGHIDWSATFTQAQALMREFGADIDVRKKVARLSAAYQQIIQITRCIAMGAKILIFDEPTASLTAQEAELLFANMRKLKGMGKSIIFITHHLHEVKAIADKVSVMRDGRMIVTRPVNEINVEDMILYMTNNKIMKASERSSYLQGAEYLRVEGYSREREFKDVSFSVGKGEIFGVSGLVGAGRTELMNALFGLTRHDAGRLFLEGKEVVIDSAISAIAHGFGYVPEERRRDAIFSKLSVKENLAMAILNELKSSLGINYSRVSAVAQQYVEKLHIKLPSLETPIANLSGGNQQKVVLARWLAKGAKILILDEPTRGIDVSAKREIHELLMSLAREGLTILVVSSETEELLSICTRIMILHEGSVKGILDNTDLSKENLLKIALG